MLARDMENYLSEVTRVLKQAGDASSHIPFNPGLFGTHEERESTIASTTAARRSGEERRHSRRSVAFDESRIRELYGKYKLHISDPSVTGRGAQNGRAEFQDIVVAHKE